MEQREKKLFAVFIAAIVCVSIIVGVSVYYGTKPSDSGSSTVNKVISQLYEKAETFYSHTESTVFVRNSSEYEV